MSGCFVLEGNSFTKTSSITSPGTYLVYNPGTYESDTIIQIGGTAPNPVVIRNLTNGDRCTLKTIPGDNEYLEIESAMGTIKRLPTMPDALAYVYHDEGYIRLAPGFPRKNILFTKQVASNVVTTQSRLSKNDEGKYVWLENQWLRIANVNDANTAVVSHALSVTGTELATIATMNEITITSNSAEFSKFELDFTPLVR